MKTHCYPRKDRARPWRSGGFVLLIVLVVVLLSSMLAASVLYAMRSEAAAHTASVQREQAWAAAMSGVARALAVATDPGGDWMGWEDNPAMFQHQFVKQDGDDQWFFTVYSASDSLGAEVRFGLTDESSKLSVRHHDPAWLGKLPGLDAKLAAALAGAVPRSETAPRTNSPRAASWAPDVSGRAGANDLPPDARSDETRLSGAPVSEGQPSEAAPSIPAASVSPVPSIEEWFAAAGLSSQLLYGEDANYNLRLDPNEDDGETRKPLDNADGQLDRGLQQHLTTISYDLNVNSDGQPRINLNDAKADLSKSGLPQATLDYVAALRRAGQALSHVAALLEAEGEFQDAEGRPQRLRSGIGREELSVVLDQCTTTNAARLEGLINVNTAPRAVLIAIPFVGEALADAILATRPGLTADEARTPAWLYRRGLVTAEEFKQIVPHLTTRSLQFSFRCLGYAVPSGRYRVLSVMVDTAPHPPRVAALRDLTRFGFPVPLAVLENGGAGGVSTTSAGGRLAW